MNLRINLILESEQRSASLVSARNMKRTLPFLIPVAVLLLGGRMAAEMVSLNAQVRTAELLWQDAEPKKAKAVRTRQQADESERILRDLEAWCRARPEWHRQLMALQAIVRPQMQLETLRVSHTIQHVPPDKKPARVFTLNLSGRAAGLTAEGDVQALTRDLRESAAFSNWVGEVDVKFDLDPRNRAHRVFQIECRYRPIFFHETARRSP